MPSEDWDYEKYSNDYIGCYREYLEKYIPLDFKWADDWSVNGRTNDGISIGSFTCGSSGMGMYVHINPHNLNQHIDFDIPSRSRIENDKDGMLKPGINPYPRYKTREEQIKGCKNAISHCTQMLMNDGWEIKDDFPRRI